jgi:glutathione peroxidase
MTNANVYDIPVRKISGEDATLGEFKGKVLLVVNVASKCGLTPQYEGLEKIRAPRGRPGTRVCE